MAFARELAAQLGRPVRYWPTDDMAQPPPSVAAALAVAPGLVRGHIENHADLYAAADLVDLSSTWEGWGLPVVEAAASGKLIVAGPYPVLDEIRAFGLTTYPLDDVAGLIDVLDRQDARENVLDANEAIVRRYFGFTSLPAALADLAETAVHLA